MVEIKKVIPLEDYCLKITFDTGEEGIFDLKLNNWLNGPIFSKLRDKKLFSQVMIDEIAHTICWSNGVDFCPDVVYKECKMISKNDDNLLKKQPHPTDTIPVRPDERFDEAKVATYLQHKLPGTDQPLTVRQFGGGAANLTYLLDYGTHQYVLRRPPLGPVVASAHDMGREYRVLSVLHKAFPLAPQAFLFCDDLSIIHSPFLIMERRQGLVVRQKLPPVYTDNPNAARQMSEALVDALADLHAVDFKALGLETLGKPQGFINRQIEGWHKRWHKAKDVNLSDMDALYIWLKNNQPPSALPTLIHNDYKLDNVMLDPTDPSRIIAIFDWDMCTLGDPLSDLGALLCYWVEPTDPPHFQAASMMPTGDLGFLTRTELVQRYAARSGRDVSHIKFYHALALYRVTVIIAQIYIRYKRGQTQDKRFVAFGPMVGLMAAKGHQVAMGA